MDVIRLVLITSCAKIARSLDSAATSVLRNPGKNTRGFVELTRVKMKNLYGMQPLISFLLTVVSEF